MKILGIESSADETAAAVVENGRNILAQTVSSSQDMQTKYGGIYPEVAARRQTEVMIPVLSETLKKYGQPLSTIDALAVTIGPGLIGSLLVGIETAKTLAYVLNKPIIPVNHVLAHLYANWLIYPNSQRPTTNSYSPPFPALCLIVSGGHTLLLLMGDHGNFKLLGTTLDDAAGEAFDKTARLLGLPYPGGPAIENLAKELPDTYRFPRGLLHSKDLNFSFSGFKTAVLREVKKLNLPSHVQLTTYNPQLAANIAASIQHAVTDVLVAKTHSAIELYRPKSVLLAGGVAANKQLTDKLSLKIKNCKLKIGLYVPPPSLCTDNAAVIASFSFYNYHPQSWQKIGVHPSLSDFEVLQ